MSITKQSLKGLLLNLLFGLPALGATVGSLYIVSQMPVNVALSILAAPFILGFAAIIGFEIRSFTRWSTNGSTNKD